MSRVHIPSEHEICTWMLQVPVATKDEGVRPLRLWGTQRVLLRRLLRGLDDDIHQFIVLKSRQVGASTFMLLLTLKWMMDFPGLQGLTVTDNPDNKEYFRDLFLEMVGQLQAKAETPGTGPTMTENTVTDGSGVRRRNQVQIVWQNQSRLLLQTTGRNTWRRLGVGRGLSFTHGTEFGLWTQGMQALTYLRSAWSMRNPAALYVLEGTARGKNFYYDVWLSAQKAKAIAPIFLGWYLREDNQISQRNKRLWSAYGYPILSAKEKEWDRLVRRREKIVITPEQWAWRRWYVTEQAGGSHRLADQEMPTVWEDAFAASQERPFLDDITQARLKANSTPPIAAYVYQWGTYLEDTKPVPAGEQEPMLRVWEPPDDRPTVVAAVPAHSANIDDPSWVVSVWAASMETDRIEQVAEFQTELNIGLQPFAWVCLHLAGAYGARHRTLILEIAGGTGLGVLAEIKRLIQTSYGTAQRTQFADVLGSVRSYIWRRPDSMSSSGALQWKSNAENEAAVLHRFRDQIQRGTVIVRSSALVEEMARLEGKSDGFAPTGDKPRSHRSMAGALGNESYVSQLYPVLQRIRRGHVPATSVGGRMTHEFFQSLGRR